MSRNTNKIIQNLHINNNKMKEEILLRDSLNNTDYFKQNLKKFEKKVISGEGLETLYCYLNQDNISIGIFKVFLDLSLKIKRKDVYSRVLSIAFVKFGKNEHIAFYDLSFSDSRLIDRSEAVSMLLNSKIPRYKEMGLLNSLEDIKPYKNFKEVIDFFILVDSKELPLYYIKPYLKIFSIITKSMTNRKNINHDNIIEGLLSYFKNNLDIYEHPWYLRLYLRLHMYLLLDYDQDLVLNASKALEKDVYNIPTSQYNLLHIINYHRINHKFIDTNVLNKDFIELINNHPSSKQLTISVNDISNAPIKKNKIAILISGQIRGLNAEQIKIINNEGYTFDIFIATWEKKGFKIPYNILPNAYYRVFPKSVVDIFSEEKILGNILYQRYPSILSLLEQGANVSKAIILNHQWTNEIENSEVKSFEIYSEGEMLDKHFKDFGIEKTDKAVLNNQSKMFYMNYKALGLLRKQEDITNEKYEYIIKVRPDLEVEIDIGNIVKETEHTQVIAVDVMRDIDCGDRVAIGKRLIMEQYLRMFENLSIYQNDSKVMFGCGTFKAHAPIDYQIVSSGGQVYRSKYLEIGDYNELELIDYDLLVNAIRSDAVSRGLDDTDKRIFNKLNISWKV